MASVHRDRHPWLDELELLLERFATELDVHMMTEEVILFPAIRRIDVSGVRAGHELVAPMRVMEQEHESAGHELSRIRTLTDDFTPPADACNSFRALIDGLRELDADMQLHVHKENNVLFSRILSLIAEQEPATNAR
jgi:regulator of cell morphogenesis and NO signaling